MLTLLVKGLSHCWISLEKSELISPAGHRDRQTDGRTDGHRRRTVINPFCGVCAYETIAACNDWRRGWSELIVSAAEKWSSVAPAYKVRSAEIR